MTEPPIRSPSQDAWRTVALLGSGQLVTWGVLYYAFAVLLPMMSDELGWTPALLSGGFSVGLVTMGVLAPVVGAVIDRSGGPRVMRAGSIVGACGVILWAAAEHPAVYLSAWVVIGAGMATVLYEPAMATVVRAHPDHQKVGILGVTMVAALASTLFTPLTWWLSARVGWRACLVILAVGVAATSELHRRLPATPTSVRRHVNAVVGSSRGARSQLSVTVGVTAATATGTAAHAHLVAVIVESERSMGLAAMVVASVGVAKLAGRVLFVMTRVADHADSARILAGILAAQALGLAAVYGPAGWLVATPLLFGSATGAITVLKPLAVSKLGPIEEFGRRSGAIHQTATLAKAAAPFLVGSIAGAAGGYLHGWLWLVGFALIASVALAASSIRLPRVVR